MENKIIIIIIYIIVFIFDGDIQYIYSIYRS